MTVSRCHRPGATSRHGIIVDYPAKQARQMSSRAPSRPVTPPPDQGLHARRLQPNGSLPGYCTRTRQKGYIIKLRIEKTDLKGGWGGSCFQNKTLLLSSCLS